jgi:hypothetical protein
VHLLAAAQRALISDLYPEKLKTLDGIVNLIANRVQTTTSADYIVHTRTIFAHRFIASVRSSR